MSCRNVCQIIPDNTAYSSESALWQPHAQHTTPLTYLHQVSQILAPRGEVEMAQEGESVLPWAPNLQVVSATHIPEVCSVAGWNTQIWNTL
jgi:hypothetical protein